MSINTDWDIEKYFDETEPEEHWELRKEFIVKNKDKHEEDYLVALAKVFTNAEFMGCSYGKEVMLKIAEMSEGVVESYRERKKSKLQRTFVKASDAAESKFAVNRKRPATEKLEFIASSTSAEMNSLDTVTSKYPKLAILHKVRQQPGLRGRLIIYSRPNSENLNPINILQESIAMCNLKLIIQVKSNDELLNNERGFDFFIGDELICSGFAQSEKEARKSLAPKAIETLKETCFTIERTQSVTDGDSIERTNKSREESQPISTDSVGAKMMKFMGWSGKGLGKNETGREELVELKEHVHRRGLGSSENMTTGQITQKLRMIVEEYAKNDNPNNLVFSSEFSGPERCLIHQLALKNHLKSRSYGSGTNRQLILSRKISLWETVEDILVNGVTTALYNLVLPSKIT